MKHVKLFESFGRIPTFEEAKEAFASFDIEVREITKDLSTVSGGRLEVITDFDGIIFKLYVMDEGGIGRAAHKFTELVRRHLDVVKKIYKFIRGKYGNKVYCMSGGGAQLQAFFGNKDGYIGTLYLDMEDEKSRIQPPGTENGNFTFVVNNSKNDKNFKDMKIPGVDVVYSMDLFGRSDDDSEGLEEYFEADNVLKALRKKYPGVKFEKAKYYGDGPEVVFLHNDNSSWKKTYLINMWNRDKNDGVDGDLAKFLKEMGLVVSWRHKNNHLWDGVYIVPTDYRGWMEYHKHSDNVKKLFK